MSILEWLGFSRADRGPAGEPSSAETATVRKIVERLDHMEPERARFVAAFSYILSRVARADLQVSEDETRAMESIVVEHGALPEELAVIYPGGVMIYNREMARRWVALLREWREAEP